MNIVLIRHGQAQAQSTSDASRALTALGAQQAQKTAAWFANQDYQVDALFVSPYVRAQQTASYVAQIFDVPLTTCDCITPDDSAQTAFEWFDELNLPASATIAIVCHMPIVARLAALLTGESAYAFEVAEAQVIELPMFALGMGKIANRFVPVS